MREQVFDRLDTDVPDAPEACVICHTAFAEDDAGELLVHADGNTCPSGSCHEAWLKGEAEHSAAEQAASDAQAADWLESERLTGGQS